MVKKALLIMVCMLLAVGCASRRVKNSAPEPLVEIETLSKSSLAAAKEQHQHKIRLEALQDTAMSLGARAGLSWRVGQINADLKKKERYLDQVFNFGALLLDENVLPPVLVESRHALNLETPHSIRVADTNYRIVKQARFVTTAPVWRDYLLMAAVEPEKPDASLLPKNREERDLWKIYTREGWDKGVEQANQIYLENLRRLKRDFQGMIRYRTLLAQNMVSSPLVAKRDLGITGGGEELSVNDRVLTIKALPALKADSKQWQPRITQQ